MPHDFSRHATRALKLAAVLAGRKGRLRVLHVVANLPEGVNRMAHGRIFASERRQLGRLVARTVAKRRGPAVAWRVESGDPYRHIIEAAPGMDSIVMCTVGRTGLSHLVIGSVAEKVVRYAPVPVLTFRPASARVRTLRPMRTGAVERARAARRRSRPKLSDPYAFSPGPPSQTWERNAENSHPEDEEVPRQLGER